MYSFIYINYNNIHISAEFNIIKHFLITSSSNLFILVNTSTVQLINLKLTQFCKIQHRIKYTLNEFLLYKKVKTNGKKRFMPEYTYNISYYFYTKLLVFYYFANSRDLLFPCACDIRNQHSLGSHLNLCLPPRNA